MYKDNEEDILYAFHECIEIAYEDDDDHRYEYNDREVLERFLQNFGDFRKILSAKHSQDERNAHDYHDALEYFPERDLKFRKFTDRPVVGKIQV